MSTLKERIDQYPAYRLRGASWMRPDKLHNHLDLYNIPSTIRSCEVLANGDCRRWVFTSGSGARRLSIAQAALRSVTVAMEKLGPLLVNAVFALDARSRQPVIGSQADVRLMVSPMLASWSELVFLKWCVREGWEVEPAEGHTWADPQNWNKARSNSQPPIVFTTAPGYGAGGLEA